MPACRAKKSSVPLHSNYWENCERDRGYDDYYRFNKDQFYEGEFFRDSIHGQGTYKWKDLAVYEGGFYSNFKEGYASLSFSDNSYFEGLFIKNQPFGPGILTHANGRQDAGFWVGRKLVRLSRAVDFVIPRLAPTSAAKIKLLQFRRLIPLNEDNWDSVTDIKKNVCLAEHFFTPYSSLIYDPRSIFFDKEVFEKTYFIEITKLSKKFISSTPEGEGSVRHSGDDIGEEEEELNSQLSQVPSHCLCPQDVFVMEYKNSNNPDICDRESFKGEYEMGILSYFTKFGTIEEFVSRIDDDKSNLQFLNGNNMLEEEAEETINDKSKNPKIVSWNRSELCTEMLKQIFRYRAFEERLSFNLAKLMLGARTAFRRTGEKEKQCLQFLKMCSIGPAHVIKDLLCSYEISEELMDARGNNSLMFAAATDQHDIIDILLDFGVDVNTFNDESLTPLNLCLLRRLAQTNGICNWETAFLPKEIDKTTRPAITAIILMKDNCKRFLRADLNNYIVNGFISDSFTQAEDLQSARSIPSLDRIFGDGMSISDKSLVLDTRFLSPFSQSSCLKNSKESFFHQNSEEGKIFSDLSQVTLFKISKSQGSYNLILPGLEDKIQKLQRRVSTSPLQGSADPINAIGNDEITPKINRKIIPKSNKRDEFEKSIQQSSTDKYLFEFSFEKTNTGATQGKEVSVKSSRGKPSKSQKEEMKEVKEVEEQITLESELTKKVAEIDKTIKKLLQRGANPNISEVPKPSIHLGVYTKDVNVVYTLLMHGASPDCQLYSNEGLLTPLHVIVLQKSTQEYVDICHLLLKFGANPEEETIPEFSLGEEEKNFLVPEQGRTPLQLLCMRPDLEYVSPNDNTHNDSRKINYQNLEAMTLILDSKKITTTTSFYAGNRNLQMNLIKIGLMLAKVSDKRHFYNGHSCLTLAMHCNNLKLLKALLDSKYYDPNDVLEEDRGTTLHVLVSTELQRKTAYETSIKICDLLIAGGANPLRKFKSPEKLLGTCVDYGYREISIEKEKRKIITSGKKAEKTGKEKTTLRDYLKDHERVVDYLAAIAQNMAKKNMSKASIDLGKKEREIESQNSSRKWLATTQKASEMNDEKSTQDGRVKVKGKENTKDTEGGKDRRKEKLEKGETSDDVEKIKKNSFSVDDKIGKKVEGEQEKKETKILKKEKDNVDHKKNEEKMKKSKKNIELESKKKRQTKEKGKGKEDERINSKKSLEKGSRKTEFNLPKPIKDSKKNLFLKNFGTRSETFPEKLRQTLLRMYGTCANIDINEFLVPYVVLRNGELYYRFQGKTNRKEQYSLV